MNYILEKLNEIEGSEEKKKEAERLLKIFGPCLGEAPSGIWSPSYEWPTIEKTEKVLKEGKRFFSELEKLFGNEKPEIFLKLHSRFKRNANQMKKLSKMDSVKRLNLPPHEFYPFFGRFNEAVHESIKSCWWNEIMLSEMIFTTEIVERGGLSTIYKGMGSKGQNLALKFFYQTMPFVDGHSYRVSKTLGNLLGHIDDILGFEGFVIPRLVSPNPPFYVTDYFPGQNLGVLIKSDNNLGKDKELLGRALAKYAEMLTYLHERNLLFVDNSLSNVLVSESEVKICDYDFVSSQEDLEKGCLAEQVGTEIYLTKERLLGERPTRLSDLEGFATMIHHLINRNPLYNFTGKYTEDFKIKEVEREKARANKRDYKIVKARPKSLVDVVSSVLTYPRDESLTASDFREAVKLDYGI